MKNPKNVALYARVSTYDQTCENQLKALHDAANRHGWNVVAEFVDEGQSGAKGREKRPEMSKLMKMVQRREVDLVASWSVDRLGRSLQDLLGFLEELKAKDVDLYLDQQGLDTSTPTGKAMFGMIGVFAEFERAMIQERVKAGLARAKAQGKALGRPTVINNELTNKIKLLREEGMGVNKIGQSVGCGNSVVVKVLKTLESNFQQ